MKKMQWLILLILILFQSCTINPRYHSRGYQINWKRNHQSNNTRNFSLKSHFKLLDTTPEMHVSNKMILSGDSVHWMGPHSFPVSYIKQLKTITVKGDSMPFHGKLMAVSENGIFLYNTDDALSFVSKSSYAKFQNHIKDRLVYIPFTDIKSIKWGKTLAGKINDVKFIVYVFSIVPSIAMTIWLYAMGLTLKNTTGTSNNLNPQILLGIIAILSIVLATVFLAIISFFIAIYHVIICHLKSNYWRINKNKIRGKKFQEDVLKRHKRFRIFKSDVLN